MARLFSGPDSLRSVRGAGITAFSAEVGLVDLEAPRPLRADEILVDVRAAGVGNWAEIARAGGWDLGRLPPMALGVQAAGVVAAVGSDIDEFDAGAPVLVESAPFRDQGAWAQQFIVPASSAAALPAPVAFDTAAGYAVPALTADQALRDGMGVSPGETVLVNGAGGVTGNLLVQFAARSGAKVVATASLQTAPRAEQCGAALVIDYRSPDWRAQVRDWTGGKGVDAAVNAVPGKATEVLDLVRDDGHLATITSDPPASARGVRVREVYVAPDGARLGRLAEMLASGAVNLDVTAVYPLEAAARALDHVRRGSRGGTIVLSVEGLDRTS